MALYRDVAMETPLYEGYNHGYNHTATRAVTLRTSTTLLAWQYYCTKKCQRTHFLGPFSDFATPLKSKQEKEKMNNVDLFQVELDNLSMDPS